MQITASSSSNIYCVFVSISETSINHDIITFISTGEENTSIRSSLLYEDHCPSVFFHYSKASLMLGDQKRSKLIDNVN